MQSAYREARMRRIVLLILTILLLVTLYLLWRQANAPGVRPESQATAPPPQEATAPPYENINDALNSYQVTDEPERESTPTPVPTEAPTYTPGPTEVRTLRKGDKGEPVRLLQEQLIRLGYLKEGSADGTFGAGTMKAVQKFQQANGLAPDGAAGEMTLRKMFGGDAR